MENIMKVTYMFGNIEFVFYFSYKDKSKGAVRGNGDVKVHVKNNGNEIINWHTQYSGKGEDFLLLMSMLDEEKKKFFGTKGNIPDEEAMKCVLKVYKEFEKIVNPSEYPLK